MKSHFTQKIYVYFLPKNAFQNEVKAVPGDYLSVLYPDEGFISTEDAVQIKEIVKKHMECDKTIDDILEHLNNRKDASSANISRIFDKSFKFFDNDLSHWPAFIDSSKLYVLIDYLKNHIQYENSEHESFSFDRKNSYLNFIDSDDSNNIKKIMYEIINSAKDNFDYGLFKKEMEDDLIRILEIKVDVVKGGISKIKEYLLEADKLNQIRGASELIKFANQTLTNRVIKAFGLINECIIYSDGGNSFIVVPNDMGCNICKKLEEEYSKFLLGAKFAFESMKVELGEFLFCFYDVSKKITKKLSVRQIVKLPEPDSKIPSQGINIPIPSDPCKTDKSKFEGTETIEEIKPPQNNCAGGICTTCYMRDACVDVEIYDEKHRLCHVCYLKYKVGKKTSSRYHNEFCIRFGIFGEGIKVPNSLDDIDDYVAFIYADGNNLGNVIMNIKNVFQMMYLSRKLESVTKDAVYDVLYKYCFVNEDEDKSNVQLKFEVIILGGEDIFMVIPANVALDVAKEIIERFDAAFFKKITLSAGILITKSTIPISSAYEMTIGILKNAKKYVKRKACDAGSVDVEVVLTSSLPQKTSQKLIFPRAVYDIQKVKDALVKIKSDESRTKLYMLREAALNLLPEEFELFYVYSKSRDEKLDKLDNAMKDLLDGNSSQSICVVNYPWDEIINLLDFIDEVKS